MKKWSNETKEKIQSAVATLSIVFGFALTAVGFAVEPVGEVSGSVIGILGECLCFGGAIFGVSLHYNNELNIFKTEVRKRLGGEEESEGDDV